MPLVMQMVVTRNMQALYQVVPTRIGQRMTETTANVVNIALRMSELREAQLPPNQPDVVGLVGSQ